MRDRQGVTNDVHVRRVIPPSLTQQNGGSSNSQSSTSARDVEAMLWDAQTALLSHDNAAAKEFYFKAVQPPHCSSRAALALFNLSYSLSVTSPDTLSPTLPPTNTNGRHAQAQSLRAPKRDAYAMNQAAGWLVLGLWWIIQSSSSGHPSAEQVESPSSDSDEGLIIPRKPRSGTSTVKPSREPSGDDAEPSTNSSDASSYTLETPGLSVSDILDRSNSEASPQALLPLLEPLLQVYRLGKIQQHDLPLSSASNHNLAELLQPLGSNVWAAGAKVIKKILKSPMADADPKGKRPQRSSSDAIDAKIAVYMIAYYIAGMTSFDNEIATRHFERVIQIGPCASSDIDSLMKHAEKRLLALPSTPLAAVSPRSMRSPSQGFPFPSVSTSSARRLQGHPSSASIFSCASSMYTRSRLLNTPIKSEVALVKLSTDDKLLDKPEIYRAKRDARDLLRKSTVDLNRARLKGGEKTVSVSPVSGWLPSFGYWLGTSPRIKPKQESMATSIEEVPRRVPAAPALATPLPSLTPPTPIDPSFLFKSQSSPILSAMNTNNLAPPPMRTHRSSCHLRKSLPFEPRPEDAINATDPALAAAELASTLTKKAACDICRAKGVNFPNCRKCGLTFCSRPCRVDRAGAGDGKRHICGAWESRQLLTVPIVSPPLCRGSKLVSAS